MSGVGFEAGPLGVVGIAQLSAAPLCLRPAVFTGPPDPLHGNSLYQKVRAAAQVSPGPRSLPAFPTWDSGSTPAAGRERLCVALRGEGGRGAEQRGGREDSGRVAVLSVLCLCLGLGGCLVLGRLVTSASLPAAQGPASSRYASTSSPITGFHSGGAHGLLP